MTVTLNKIQPGNALGRDYFRAGPLRDGVLTPVTVSVNGTAAKFDLTAFSFAIAGSIYATAAQAALVFSAAHVITDGGWGAIYVLINAAGLVSTLVSGATQTTAQNYGTEALALAALPAVPAGYTVAATFTILRTGANFVGNTTALNDAGLTSVNLLGTIPDRRWRMTRPDAKFEVAGCQTWCRSKAGTPQVNVIAGKESSTYNQVVTNPFLEVDRRTAANASVTKLRFAGFDYRIGGVLYHTDAQKQLAFTAAHVVTADKWGAILLLIDTAGVYSTLVGEVAQTTAMAYTSAALARAALPAVPATKIAVGILVIEAKNATWTANTDDIVAASDLENFDLVPALADRLLDNVTLAIDAVPEKFKSSAAFDYTVDGVKYSKLAATAIQFTAAHAATASKYLAILIGINAAGTVSSKVPLVDGRSQTAAQGYDSYDLAIAALPTPTAGVVPIGIIVLLADGTGWVANTDDMTPGSDLTNVWFVGLTTTQLLQFKSNAAISVTQRNRLWPVVGAAFAANALTNATLRAGNNRLQTVRGDENAELAIYIAATADAAAQGVDATVTQRPWPMAGEPTS